MTPEARCPTCYARAAALLPDGRYFCSSGHGWRVRHGQPVALSDTPPRPPAPRAHDAPHSSGPAPARR